MFASQSYLKFTGSKEALVHCGLKRESFNYEKIEGKNTKQKLTLNVHIALGKKIKKKMTCLSKVLYLSHTHSMLFP